MTGKSVANRYIISVKEQYKEELLKNFRGRGSAPYIRQFTKELWTPPTCELTCAQFGAFRRILMMMARDKDAINSNNLLTTLKELKSYGISRHLLDQLRSKQDYLDIFLMADCGEIKDIPWD